MTETNTFRNIDLSSRIALYLARTFDLRFMARRFLMRSAKTELAFRHKEIPAWYAAFGCAVVGQPAWHCDREYAVRGTTADC